MAIEITRYDILPIICLPILFAIGLSNLYCTIISFIAIIVILLYVRISIKPRKLQTKFFFSWTICSVIYLWGLFEMTVQSNVLLPREHYFLATMTFVSLFSFQMRKAKRKTSVVEGDELQGVTCYTRHATCSKCRRPFISSGPLICSDCQRMLGRWKHYCLWLNCYITEKNHLFFLLGHTFAAAALLVGANLSVTSVCRPVLVWQTLDMNLTLPEDCSHVYVEPETALCFIGSIYATSIGLYSTFILLRQIFRFSAEKISLFWWRRN